ncbi:MAG TPA: hypothetical protein VNO31_21625, partial [Umezawaea sp.]|nr:hypothetical protein [Umezawaea sp.]
TRTPTPVGAPSAVTVEQVSQVSATTVALRLSWTRATDAVRQYRVYRRNTDGTRTFLGGTPNDAYYVPAVAKAPDEAITLEVVAVSEAFATSAAGEVTVP